jgi:hypothetical protein
MQLSDLIHLTVSRIFPPPVVRSAERKILTVPLHEAVDKPQMQSVLAAAAEQIAISGIVWKWHCYDGSDKLVSWDSKQQVFLRGSLEDWAIFIGRHWIVRDTSNREYLGPSLVVCDRLVAAVLAHPETPIADWALQLAMKRKATAR